MYTIKFYFVNIFELPRVCSCSQIHIRHLAGNIYVNTLSKYCLE